MKKLPDDQFLFPVGIWVNSLSSPIRTSKLDSPKEAFDCFLFSFHCIISLILRIDEYLYVEDVSCVVGRDVIMSELFATFRSTAEMDLYLSIIRNCNQFNSISSFYNLWE